MTDTPMEETEPSSTSASTPASTADVGRSQSQKQRRQQVAIACVRCRRRKIRCNGRFPCEPCLRLRQTCQEPEVKRAPSRASLGRRIEQLEALASEAGIDIFSKPQQQQQQQEQQQQHQQQQQQEGAGSGIHPHNTPAVEGNRNRSLSAASAGSNFSLPGSLPQLDTSDLLPPPDNNSGHAPMAQSPGSAALSPLDIPMIEVTASSRRQSPEPWGNPYASTGTHTPELATPALSTGSLSVPPSPALAHPWLEQVNLPPQHDTFMGGNPLSLEPDAFSLSRRSSVSSHGVQQHMGQEAGLAPSNHLSVDSTVRKPHSAVPHPHSPDMLSPVPPSFPNDIYGGVDISNLNMQQQPQMASPATNAGSAFSAYYANLCSSAYFEWIHPFFPFQDDHETYLAYERAVYNNEPLESMSNGVYFQVYIVQAIGARILEYQQGIQKSFRESYFYAALLCHNSFHRLETLPEVQSALLLLLYSIYCDAPQIQPLRLKATITSSCVQLGLHEPRHDTSPLSLQATCELQTFLSAYVLDRSLSLAHGQPFSLSDDDIEIETLVSQLTQNTSHPHPQPEARHPSSYSSHTAPVLAATAKLSRILSTIHTVYSYSRPHNTHGIPRLSTPFLTTATPTTLSRWRGEIFRTLEKLTAEVRQLRDVAQMQNTLSPSAQGTGGSDSKPLTIPDLVEAQINECILFLLHPPPTPSSSSSPSSPATEGVGNVSLNPFEAAAMQSTARTTASIYRHMQDAKALLPSAPLARGLFLTGTTLTSCLGAQTGGAGGGAGGNAGPASQSENKKAGSGGRKSRRESHPSKARSGNPSPATGGARADDPDVMLCTGLLRWLGDEGVDVARGFVQEMESG